MTVEHRRGLMFDALREVIAALDRRRPRRDDAGEQAIVREAASMRGAAVARVAALRREQGTTDEG